MTENSPLGTSVTGGESDLEVSARRLFVDTSLKGRGRHYHTFMSTLTDQLHFVVGAHGEQQLASVHLDQFHFRLYRHADWRGRDVGDFDYGISSGALRAAMFAQNHPELVARLALDAFVWTGEGSPTLEERRKKLPQFIGSNRRPIDKAFVQSIFARDHPGTAEDKVVDAFAEAITALDDSIPNGTYIDMCSRLPVVDPEKITAPTIVMRGEYDGIAGIDDLLAFFAKLPHPDKQFTVMEGISHASFQQKNYLLAYDILEAFFSRPELVYRGQ